MARASTAHRSRIRGARGWLQQMRRRKRTAKTTGMAIMRIGNQLIRISPTAMSPKAPATMVILVREKRVRKVLNRW